MPTQDTEVYMDGLSLQFQITHQGRIKAMGSVRWPATGCDFISAINELSRQLKDASGRASQQRQLEQLTHQGKESQPLDRRLLS